MPPWSNRVEAAQSVPSVFRYAHGQRTRDTAHLSPMAAALARDGAVVLDQRLPAGDVESLRDRVIRPIEEGETPLGATVRHRWADDPGHSDHGMIDAFGLEHAFPDLTAIPDRLGITTVLQELCGATPPLDTVHCYINQGVTKTRGWHVDYKASDQFKAFLYLTDVTTEADGPYAYQLGSHRSRYRKSAGLLRTAVMGDAPGNMLRGRSRRFLAPAGTCILSNNAGIHRGWPQAAGHRREMLVFRYQHGVFRADPLG